MKRNYALQIEKALMFFLKNTIGLLNYYLYLNKRKINFNFFIFHHRSLIDLSMVTMKIV